jgi:glyoxylase-like metal-dependent hydrolase (beta-lactamase superfamily II)
MMGKINLIAAKGNSFFCDGIFSVGVYVKNDEAILIDSGISKDYAKEINKALIENKLQLKAIINTHSHGDHSGGNAFFQQKYPDLKIFSTETERPFIEDPQMAPICFCGGAAAFDELKKCKPITPQQVSRITDLITPYQDQKVEIIGETFEIVTLPGHTRGMIAVKTPDHVLYCGDVVFGHDTFNKYPILFYTFIDDTLKSFRKLKQMLPSIDVAIIYHGGIIADLSSLIDEHEQRILETRSMILNLLQKQPHSIEEITAKIMQKFHIPDDLISYTLTKTPIQAFVAELQRENLIEMIVSDGLLEAHLLKNGSHESHVSEEAVL